MFQDLSTKFDIVFVRVDTLEQIDLTLVIVIYLIN